MKQKVLVNFSITCDPPRYVVSYCNTIERKVKALEEWCREFEYFIRDHRSQDCVSLTVEREYEDQCSYCGNKWEVDEDGPTCCDEALLEWKNAIEVVA